ncbi:MAG: thioredoxin domain-containing protein [Chloroflexi bacterium]|nr:thioredoxin domain-containing protein [Chloroflexota bacterium]
MTNHLATEISPYLLQHAENPVDWYPWGEAALEKARREDKPIFLSIGYAACHWCHVMAHESFEDPEIAAFLNDHFVSIKVDREERPDLDSIYIDAVTAMTGQGGWPLTVFLTPSGKPFYGGTYFPPHPEYGMPAFRQVLEGVAQVWQNQREEIEAAGEKNSLQLRQALHGTASSGEFQPEFLSRAAQILIDSYDWTNGGWGTAPKFPQPMVLEFLLTQATRGNQSALDIVVHNLEAMQAGGMYDLLGGGFHRYSIDSKWLVPHFEKMLYDNAQLARVYLHAYLLTRAMEFRETCEQTLDFMLHELADPQGGFYSSLDADSREGEGEYYLWSKTDIETLIPDPQEIEIFMAAYGFSDEGNFAGKNILRQTYDAQSLSHRFNIPEKEMAPLLSRLRRRLVLERTHRPRPATDDKVLTSWNALAIQAFVEAGRFLNREDYLATAQRCADFLLTQMLDHGHLFRSWRQGQARREAYLEDYASLAIALLSLYQADANLRWFTAAQDLTATMIATFRGPRGEFTDTCTDNEELIVLPRNLQDNATPCGNSLAAAALLQLTAFTDHSDWRDEAISMLGSVQQYTTRYPKAFAHWLTVMDFAAGPIRQVAILGPREDPATQTLIEVVCSTYRPRSILAVSELPLQAGSPTLLFERSLIERRPTAYVCEGFTCRLPVTHAQDLAALLDEGTPAGAG